MTRSVEVSLSWNNPDCGNCLEQVEHDGDGYFCPRCRISWGDDNGFTADYHDDDATPCGEPYPDPTPVHDSWEDTRRHVTRAYVRHDYPCDLPAGHDTVYHHHPHLHIHCRED